MADTAYPVFQHYGTNAARLAFTPAPAAGTTPLYIWYETDTDNYYIYTTAWKGPFAAGGSGTVTNTGTLTANALIVGNGGVDVTALGSLGTTATVLHGNAAGAPTFGAVALATDVSGDLPFANLTQIAGLSVLGVTGSATADVAAITAGTDGHVLTRVSSSSLAFAAPAASGLVLLHTYTASTSASIDITSMITSTYRNYRIELDSFIPASNSRLRFLVSTDNGSTWDTSNVYRWTAQQLITAVSSTQINGGTATSWDFNTGDATLLAGGAYNGSWMLFNPLSASLYKVMYGDTSLDDNSSGFIGWKWYGTWRSSTAVNAIQIKFASGNITSGTVSIYGLSK